MCRLQAILFVKFALWAVVDGQVYSDFTMTLNMLGTSSSLPACIGCKYDFELKLDLTEPQIYSNFSFELFSPLETSTRAMTRLCHVTTTKDTVFQPPTLKESADSSNSWTYFYFNMGSVTSPGTTEIKSDFSVFVSEAPVSSSTISLIINAAETNGSENVIHIAYFPISFAPNESLIPYEEAVTQPPVITGPNTMKLNETQVFYVDLLLDRIAPNLTFDVSLPANFTSASIISVRLADLQSANWFCIDSPPYLYYPHYFTPFQASNFGNQMATLNMGVLCNIGARSVVANDPNNVLKLEFVVHVYGHDISVIGSSFTLTANFYIDSAMTVTKTATVTIFQTMTSISGSLPNITLSPFNTTSTTIPVGSIVPILVVVTLPQNVSNDYKIRLMPDPSLTNLYLSAAYIQFVFQGFNVHYVLNVPDLTTVQYIYNNPSDLTEQSASGAYLDLGFIANTGQVMGNCTEDQIWFLATFQLSAINTPGGTFITTVQLLYNQDTENQSPFLTWQMGPSVLSPVFPTLTLSYSSSSTTQGQRIALSVIGDFGANKTGIIDGPLFQLDATEFTGSYQICELRVTSAGINLPTLQYRVDVQDRLTVHDTISDALLDLGRVCLIGYDKIDPLANQFIVRAIAEAPIGLATNNTYSFHLNALMELADAGLPPLTLSHSETQSFITTGYLFANTISLVSGSIYNYEVVQLLVRIKINPTQSGDYHLTVTVNDKLQICGLQVFYAGDNIPCHGINTKYFPSITSYSQMLTLNVGVLTNVGPSAALSPYNFDDDNSLTLSIAIWANNVVTAQPATIVVSDNVSPSVTLQIQEQSSLGSIITGSPPQIVHFGSNFENGTNTIVPGVIYHFKLQVLVSKYSMQNITVQLFGPLDIAGDTVRFCSAMITSVGANLPCLGDTIEPTFQNLNGSSYNNTFSFDLGFVCRVDMINSQKGSYNSFSVEFAFELPTVSSITIGSNFHLTAVVQNQIQTLSLTSVNGPPYFSNRMNFGGLSSVNANPSATPLRVGQTATVQFNVSISANYSQQAKLLVNSAVLNGTPALHIDSIEIIGKGLNIPCFPSDKGQVVYNSTSNPSTLYMDTAVIDFGWIVNTGSTYRTKTGGVPEDDEILLSATVLLTDNIMLVNDQSVLLNVQLILGGTNITNGFLSFQTDFTNTTPTLVSDLSIIAPQSSYSVGDLFSVHFDLSHDFGITSAELWALTLTLFLPSSTTFLNMVSNNTLLITTQGSQYLQISYPRLLFLDQVNLTLNFQLSSFNATVFSSNVITAIPYQLEYFTWNRVTNSLPMVRTTTKLSDIRFDTVAKPCTLPFINQISACQILTSSNKLGISSDNVKYGSAAYWSPELRFGDKPWIKLSFNNSMIINQLRFASSSLSYRKPTNVEISYSLDGSSWITSMTTSVSYVNDESLITLNSSITSRFLLISILSVDTSNSLDAYIGVQLEVYGCPATGFSSQTTNVCFNPDMMEIWGNRQLLAFGTASAIFCHYNPKKSIRQCFLTSDGNQWTNLYSFQLGYINGTDISTGYLYGSSSNLNVTMESRDSGQSWSPISTIELQSIQLTSNFVKSVTIPYVSSVEEPFASDSMTMGNWKAEFDGLYAFDGSGWSTQPRLGWIM